MTISISTCLANRIAGQAISVTDAGSQISFTAPNLITTTQSDWLTQGFRPDQAILITSGGSTTQTVLYHKIASLTSSVITVAADIVTEAAAIDTCTISVVNGLNWLTIFKHGIMEVRSSPMPSTADVAETGTLLLKFTVDAGAFTAGVSTNGLQFEFNSAGQIQILSTQTWQASGITDGTAYYARIYDNAYITGNDAVNLQSPRIQGRVGTSGQDFDITSTSVVSGVLNTCDSMNITQPLT